MSKLLTAAEVKRVADAVAGRLGDEITALEYGGHDGGWFRPVQEGILGLVAEAVVPIVAGALEDTLRGVEAKREGAVRDLRRQNKELEKALAEYTAIAKMIDDARVGAEGG